MANELVLNATLLYNKNNVQISLAIQNLRVTVTGNGLESLASYSLTTADTAIPLGTVSSAGGWLFVQNTDVTNYITIKSAVSGTAMIRVLPGEFALFRLEPGITAPSFQAHTGTCVVKFAIFDL